MILPTKRINEDRALLYVGGEILKLLSEPKTISRVWEELKRTRIAESETTIVTYDWFVLALDLLYALCAVEYDQGRIRKHMR